MRRRRRESLEEVDGGGSDRGRAEEQKNMEE